MDRMEFWDKMYNLYKDYVDKHSKTSITLDAVEYGVPLGGWVYQQYYERDKLSEEQTKKLEELGFKWDLTEIVPTGTSKLVWSWLDKYALLVEYEKEKGHTLLTCAERYKDVPLGSWLYRQRLANLNGDLTAGKELLLLNLGVFLGSWDEQGWDYKYYYAERYYRRYKNLKVPMGYQIGGFNLYSWLEFQKQKKLEGLLEAERVRKLEMIGIQWSKSYKDKWEEKYEIAKKYKEERGSLDTERNQVYEGVNLDAWLNNQRRARRGEKHRRITEEQIIKLDALGMKW